MSTFQTLPSKALAYLENKPTKKKEDRRKKVVNKYKTSNERKIHRSDNNSDKLKCIKSGRAPAESLNESPTGGSSCSLENTNSSSVEARKRINGVAKTYVDMKRNKNEENHRTNTKVSSSYSSKDTLKFSKTSPHEQSDNYAYDFSNLHSNYQSSNCRPTRHRPYWAVPSLMASDRPTFHNIEHTSLNRDRMTSKSHDNWPNHRHNYYGSPWSIQTGYPYSYYCPPCYDNQDYNRIYQFQQNTFKSMHQDTKKVNFNSYHQKKSPAASTHHSPTESTARTGECMYTPRSSEITNSEQPYLVKQTTGDSNKSNHYDPATTGYEYSYPSQEYASFSSTKWGWREDDKYCAERPNINQVELSA